MAATTHIAQRLLRKLGQRTDKFNRSPHGCEVGHNSRSGRSLTVECKASKTIRFRMHRKVDFGEAHRIVGSVRELGKWNVDNGLRMEWHDGDVWIAETQVDDSALLEFKAVHVGDKVGQSWEQGDNRVYQLEAGNGSVLDIALEWGDTLSCDVLTTPASENGAGSSSEESDSEGAIDVNGNGAGFVDEALLERTDAAQWRGKETTWMTSNEHSRERSGSWSTEGLEGAARALVEGDSKSSSWLQKLGHVEKLLVSGESLPDVDTLVNVFLYLHWISTGSIACVEGGGHYRPNRHAELSKAMFGTLERCISEAAFEYNVRSVARRMHTKLPSFTEAFTQSVPLTRIRDIAHRSDIPHDLKRTIKHTLQNKLHRNAGPEDLVAAEQMLNQLQASAEEYPKAFLDEFQLFVKELREFFQAGSIRDMLEVLQPSLDEGSTSLVLQFLESKSKVDELGSEASMNDIMDCLHKLTTVRAILASGLSSGLRNDAPYAAMAMRQRWRMAEIRSEDYAFVLLSRMINLLESKGGAQHLSKAPDSEWSLPIGALVLGIRHLGLGAWSPSECIALEHDLAAWQEAGNFRRPSASRRLLGSVERARRMTQVHTDAAIALFSARAAALGRGLGLSERLCQVFTEAEVRSSVVFQLSKLCQVLAKAARLVNGASEWESLVAGSVAGRLVVIDHMRDAASKASSGEEPVVLLVAAAEGDEDVKNAGPGVQGVILCQELPHLSHLAVRARQESVVMATCSERDQFDRISKWAGDMVTLSASVDSVTVDVVTPSAAARQSACTAAADEAAAAAAAAAAFAVSAGQDVGMVPAEALPLAEAASETCGAKSAACGRLLRAAAASSGAFGAAKGMALTYGCLTRALKDAGKMDECERLFDSFDKAAAGHWDWHQLERISEQLQALVEQLRPPREMLEQVAGAFPDPETRVMVRSSANVEDLQGMASAGVYKSLADVRVGDSEDLGAAIAAVWGSLFSWPAMSRRLSDGIPHEHAAMGVLVQEMLRSELSFVLHTRSPVDRSDDRKVYAEVAVGMGETLASGMQGTPWRLAVDKVTRKVETLAYANFSTALRTDVAPAPVPAGAPLYAKRAQDQPGVGARKRYSKVPVEYNKERLSTSEEYQRELGARLAEIGVQLEVAFGGAQDVEGAVVGDDVYVVQTRPQP